MDWENWGPVGWMGISRIAETCKYLNTMNTITDGDGVNSGFPSGSVFTDVGLYLQTWVCIYRRGSVLKSN